MKTVSAKQTSTFSERCDRCHLWFEVLHPADDGSFMCRGCLEIEGANRAELTLGSKR